MLGKTVDRWSGPAAAVGSPLFVATFLSHSFWKVLDSIGLAGIPHMHPILAEIGLVLTIIGLLGLYRQLPARTRSANVLTTAVALSGAFAAMIAVLTFVIALPEAVASLLPIGFIAFFLGLAGMSVIIAATGALGRWRFLPAVLLISLVAAVLSAQGRAVESPALLARGFFALYAICWLLLGVALWSAQDGKAASAVPAAP